MASYANLLADSLKNGYRHIVYLMDRIEEIPPNLYINICTGNFIKYGLSNSRNLSIKNLENYDKTESFLKRYFKDKSYKVYLRDGVFPLAYMNKKLGFYYHNEIDHILLKYYEWMLDFSKNKDEKRLKRLILKEIEKTDTFRKKQNLWELKSLKDGEVSDYENSFINDEIIEEEEGFERICEDFMTESDEEMSVIVEIEVEDWGFEDFNEEFIMKKKGKRKKECDCQK